MIKQYFALAALLAAGVACGEDSSSSGSGGDSSGAGGQGASSPGGAATDGSQSADGTTGGGAMQAGASGAGDTTATGGGATSSADEEFQCINTGEDNLDCPVNVGPVFGSCAPKGECCHRASNDARMAMLGPDEPAVLEYRLNLVEVTNHPLTVNQPVLLASAAARADICSGEQCFLWRFTVPRQGGELVAGEATMEFGIGAYNCDGTYSFYGDSAAPARDGISDKPSRWASTSVKANFDPAREGIDQYEIPFETNKNRELVRSIFLDTVDNSIDWELASSGFEITELDTSEAGRDCMGVRDGLNWAPVAGFVSYSPIVGNDVDINNLISQTYCSLLGFGILPEGSKDMSCSDTPRCVPGSADCPWVKLPDSLCPETDEERALFGCHLGDEGNVNGEAGYPSELNCTQEAPAVAQDPAQGITTVGQCCDPLGESSTLPACNAWRTVQTYVAAAAEITDEPRNSLPSVCD